jgi:membrane associated rhomboid family serine protease
MDMDTTIPDSDIDGTAWQEIMPEAGVRLDKRQAHLLALVLDSRSIPCCITTDSVQWQLFVPERHAASALMELQQFEEQNRNWPPTLPAARVVIENTLPTLSVLLLLATFHNITLIGFSLPGYGLLDLNELGLAHAAGIRDGQWWRAVTALTLHTDLTHLLSNIAIGGVFIILLCRELGSGLAWCLLLCSGTLGNLLNAWVQSPAHRSVGASTAVFGAVGILAAISAMRDRHHVRRRWFIPVAAGLALLALLGTEGKQTDLGAHLFGFGFGTLFGLTAEYLISRFGRPGRPLNVLLALTGVGLVVAAWYAALASGTN